MYHTGYNRIISMQNQLNHLSKRLKCLVTFALLIVAGCGEQNRLYQTHIPDLSQSELEQFDVAVQLQYKDIYSKIQEAKIQGELNSADLGQLVGQLALWYHTYGLIESAKATYAIAQTLDPAEAKWSYFQGILARNDGDIANSILHFKRAANLSDTMAAPQIELGELAAKSGDWSNAKIHFSKALAIGDEPNRSNLGLAKTYIATDQASLAIPLLEDLLKVQPSSTETRYLLGKALIDAGETERGRSIIESAASGTNGHVVVFSNNPWLEELAKLDVSARTLTRKGVNARNRGDLQTAARLAAQAITSDPGNPLLHANYANILREMGKLQPATYELEKSLKIDEHFAPAHAMLGEIRMSQKRYAEATESFSRALDSDPEYASAKLGLAHAYRLSNNAVLAVQTYSQLLLTENPGSQTYFWATALNLSLGNWVDAVTSLTDGLKRFPEDPLLIMLYVRTVATNGSAIKDPGRWPGYVSFIEAADPTVVNQETMAMVRAYQGNMQDAQIIQSAVLRALESKNLRKAANIARRRLVQYQRERMVTIPWNQQELPVSLSTTSQ